jgi:hypothetical protein
MGACGREAQVARTPTDLHPGRRTSPVKPGYRPKVILLPSSLGMFVDGVTTRRSR